MLTLSVHMRPPTNLNPPIDPGTCLVAPLVGGQSSSSDYAGKWSGWDSALSKAFHPEAVVGLVIVRPDREDVSGLGKLLYPVNPLERGRPIPDRDEMQAARSRNGTRSISMFGAQGFAGISGLSLAGADLE